jgi:hypothetical protein
MESNNNINHSLDWINDENNRATDLAKTGETLNNQAPRLVAFKKKTTPLRMVKSIYIQKSHSQRFAKLAFDQKLQNGKTTPELMEEAIELILKKYKIEF